MARPTFMCHEKGHVIAFSMRKKSGYPFRIPALSSSAALLLCVILDD